MSSFAYGTERKEKKQEVLREKVKGFIFCFWSREITWHILGIFIGIVCVCIKTTPWYDVFNCNKVAEAHWLMIPCWGRKKISSPPFPCYSHLSNRCRDNITFPKDNTSKWQPWLHLWDLWMAAVAVEPLLLIQSAPCHSLWPAAIFFSSWKLSEDVIALKAIAVYRRPLRCLDNSTQIGETRCQTPIHLRDLAAQKPVIYGKGTWINNNLIDS